ncbi:hypothetical protein GCM10010123_34480 [Pilimelia anulata]|uniref:Uncharacterized protein n=1 Tax=Pilimelia anulata TaxID=53371 RepID=A0A8J3B7P9_9ACTN|nr:hypothetical protein [Pilimelia anulata]GGK01708.1 hypothetical protein GCM10010123_34480 [Pilimelia anulata]
MNSGLADVVMIAALALAAAGGLATALDRRPGRVLQLGAGLVELLVVILAAVVAVELVGGDRPAEPTTFAGYAITTLALLPGSVILARMEPTRWGSAIIGGAGLLLPVLILRLQQVHG